MNKTAFLLLTLIVFIFIAFPQTVYADMPDFSTMSNEDLQEIITAARNELSNRQIEQSNATINNSGNIILDGWEFDSTYVSNEFYNIVDTASYKDSGHTVLIHKVIAKQNAALSSSIVAVAHDGSVIGKSSDDIVLTEGQFNYFWYSFDSDISNATLSVQVKSKQEFTTGERNAVEMVQYNQAENELYITLRQVTDHIGSFAKFKLLLYNADKIVDAKDGYIAIYAENLAGAGTTDVASIWVSGIQFDRVEYIFEP